MLGRGMIRRTLWLIYGILIILMCIIHYSFGDVIDIGESEYWGVEVVDDLNIQLRKLYSEVGEHLGVIKQ